MVAERLGRPLVLLARHAEMAQDELAQGRALWLFPPIGLHNGGRVAFWYCVDEGLPILEDPLALHRFEQGTVDLLRAGWRRSLRQAEQRGERDGEVDRSAHIDIPPYRSVRRRNG